MALKTGLSVAGTPTRRVVIIPKNRFVPALNNLIAKSVIGRAMSKVGARRFSARVINLTRRVKVVKR